MKRMVLFFVSTFFVLYSAAQQPQDWVKFYDQLGDIDDVESSAWESTYDILCDLATHPIALNTATQQDLEQIPFLTDAQIEELCMYVYQYGGMKSWGELALIESLDEPRRRLLPYFLTLDSGKDKTFPSLRNIAKYGHSEVVTALRIPCYTRKGDRKGYLGYPYKHWLRYTFSYGQYVKAGLTASQDAGEPFFSGRNRYGYDYYSPYLMLRNMGRLKAFAVGRYRLRFGMGLVMNNDFGFGKAASIALLGRTSTSIRAHSSRSEANYMQGAAATIGLWKGLELTGFASLRKIDATLSRDSTSIVTLLHTGYHRTPSEMARKHNAEERSIGGNIRYSGGGFHIGATGVFMQFSKPLTPKTEQLYRRYAPAGRHFWNAGIDYGYTSRRLNINGETATGDCRALATLNSISYQLTGSLTLLAIQRFYAYRYAAIHAESFSDGGDICNESGLYLGADWRPTRSFSLSVYTDYAYSPWAKYRISHPSHSWDNALSAIYTHRSITFLARYRLRRRQRDNADKTTIVTRTEQRGRFAVAYDGSRWNSKTQADIACCRTETNSLGWMLTQNIGYSHRFLTADASFGYFHTDNYDSRLYAYERGLLYTFTFPAFFGHGIRYAFRVRTDITPHLFIIAKIGTTDYFDRNHISTALQQIDHSAQTDIDLQVRWRF
ncbi:helix-hairpin-helix domain-containing protein [Hoylesella enoeca]|uniref:helix-hairpin-helix domain-containing protein n=1 Tax=Hoylesella enoeca TaxID=76123 RepID=UPI003FA11646